MTRGRRTLSCLLPALILAAAPGSASAVEPLLRLEAGANVRVESNPLRVALYPETHFGVREHGRLWVGLREPMISLGFGGGASALHYPALADPARSEPTGFDRLTEWHLGVRVVPGEGTRFEVELAPTIGIRATPEDRHDEPDGEPGDILTLPRRRDRHPVAVFPGYDLRGAIPARLSFVPFTGMRVTVHGGVRGVSYYAQGDLLTPGSTALLHRLDGGAAARVEWSASHAFGLRLDLGFTQSQGLGAAHRLANLDPGTIQRFWTLGTINRAGGVAGVVVRPSDVLRVDVRVGAMVGHDSSTSLAYTQTPVALVGLVRARLAPNPTTRLELGVGRDARLPRTLLGTETSAWVRFDATIADRVEPQAGFQWSYRDGLPEALQAEHRWTGGGGAAVRLWKTLYVEAGYRFSMLNPSSTNQGEYVAHQAFVGVLVRADPGERLGDRWGSGLPYPDDEPPAARPAPP